MRIECFHANSGGLPASEPQLCHLWHLQIIATSYSFYLLCLNIAFLSPHLLHEANSSSLAHINSICQPAITCLYLVSKSLNQLKLMEGKKKSFLFSSKDYDLMLLCVTYLFNTFLSINYSGYWECNSQPESSALRELNVRDRQRNRSF